jgi:hypothetical protein
VRRGMLWRASSLVYDRSRRPAAREKSPITLFAVDSAGRPACLTGVVQSIEFDRHRPAGMRWRVEMDLWTAASTGPRRKTRQRTK